MLQHNYLTLGYEAIQHIKEIRLLACYGEVKERLLLINDK